MEYTKHIARFSVKAFQLTTTAARPVEYHVSIACEAQLGSTWGIHSFTMVARGHTAVVKTQQHLRRSPLSWVLYWAVLKAVAEVVMGRGRIYLFFCVLFLLFLVF